MPNHRNYRATYSLELRSKPGVFIKVSDFASMIRSSKNYIYERTSRAELGEWVQIGEHEVRKTKFEPAGEHTSTAPDADAIRAALERGSNGLCADSDYRAAIGWDYRQRREQEDHAAVMAGMADLIIDEGKVKVLRSDRIARASGLAADMVAADSGVKE